MNITNYYEQKRIFFSNALYNDLKWGSILASKGMILPSHGENFGVSLAESLSLGKPVITTNKVNIANDIIKYKAGLISNNNTSSFSKKLFEFDNLRSDDPVFDSVWGCNDEEQQEKNFYEWCSMYNDTKHIKKG